MSSTNKTQYYNLPQYIASDKPTFLGDFNEAMRTIDSTMESNRVAAAQAGTGMSEAQENLTTAQTDVGNAQTQLNALAAQVQKIENDSADIATNASNAFSNANQANQTAQTAVTTASQAVQTAQSANTTAASLNAQITDLDSRVSALEENMSTTKKQKSITLVTTDAATGYNPGGNSTYTCVEEDNNPFSVKITLSTTGGGGIVTITDVNGTINVASGNTYTITPKADNSWQCKTSLVYNGTPPSGQSSVTVKIEYVDSQ